MTWLADAEAIASLGEVTLGPGSLAGCAAARRVHRGQFFTPPAVVDLVWHLLRQVLAPRDGERVRVIDTTCGSGRLLAPACPDHHDVWGCDSDADVVAVVADAHRQAGFRGEIVAGCIEERRPQGFDVALINPPFSLTWDSPVLDAYSVCHRGRHHARSAALSHWYCLEQATRAAPVVAAILPRSAAQALLDAAPPVSTKLADLVRLVLWLPRQAFSAEGACVETAVVVLTRSAPTVPRSVRTLACLHPTAYPDPLAWDVLPRADRCLTTLGQITCDPTQPAIVQEPTGDVRVTILRAGRYLALRTACGGTRARALNRLLIDRLPPTERHQSPRPRGVIYRGQGRLDIEVHLSQPDPLASVEAICTDLRAIGLEPAIDPQLAGYLRRATCRTRIARTPMRHEVAHPGGAPDSFAWGAGQSRLRLRLAGPLALPGITLPAAAVIDLTHTGESLMNGAAADPQFAARMGENPLTLPLSAWLRLGSLDGLPTAGWQVVHPGLAAAYPQHYSAEERRMRSLSLERVLTRGYQWDDCAELRVARSAICAWDMGLGKSRLAIALALLGGARNLIVVQARLIAEMVSEFTKLGIPESDWQVIAGVEQARQLRRINIISLNRLRQPLGGYHRGASRYSIARQLRRRLHTVIIDEAHALRNHASEQTRAVWMLSPRRVYDLSGTPIANYPRDILPLLVHVAGDATAAQPYGLRRGYIEPGLIASMAQAQRGPAAFADAFVVTEWVTNEFLEDLTEGAKREIPVIADVPRFRAMVAPHIKRRVIQEPEVAAHITIPTPSRETVDVAWDQDHLDAYVETVREFATWYRTRQHDPHQRSNLAMLLRKIGTVVQAVNAPQWMQGPSAYRGSLTSKQRAVIARIVDEVAGGHTVLSICHAPAVADLLADRLSEQGIPAVRFHGGIPIADRTRAKDREFRSGRVPVMCATIGCVKEGLNLPEADRTVFYDRDWTATAEEQAERRLLRPEQRRPVHIMRFHLAGSLDTYQDQLVTFKAQTVRSGLDYGDPGSGSQSFLHLETILAEFLEDFGTRYGYNRHGQRVVA